MKSIELFSGAGGLALGLHMAGFQHQLLVEADHDAFETLRHNSENESITGISSWPLVHGKVESTDLTLFTDTDLLAAGIPCQPFSNGGRRRGLDDGRNMFPTFANAVATMKPRVFLLENVNGLIHGQLAEHLEYAVLQLSNPGCSRRVAQTWREHMVQLRSIPDDQTSYKVVYRVLNAPDYGVPQIRKRVFIVGFRRDLNFDWDFPGPTHSRDVLVGNRSPNFGSSDHYGSLPSPCRKRHSASNLNGSQMAKYAWTTVGETIRNLPRPGSDRAIAMQHIFIPGARPYRGHTGSTLDWPAKSLKAGVHGVGGGENMLLNKDGKVRYFTIRECAKLQTFPDSWSFEGARSSVTRQIGNAVPVELARVIAESISHALKVCASIENVHDKNITEANRFQASGHRTSA